MKDLTPEVIEDWIEELWLWADETHVLDLEWIEDEDVETGGYYSGFPRNVNKLLKLETLYLYNNQLKKLPTEIGCLGNLKDLSLKKNKLKLIPKEVGLLVNLKILSISENQLEILPEEIGSLINLEELYLYDNKLEKLPIEIEKLTKLKRVYLSNNQLIKLPEGIGNLLDLEILDISSNKLTKLPEKICKLTRLKSLYLSDNLELVLTQEQKEWVVCLKRQGCAMDVDCVLLERVDSSVVIGENEEHMKSYYNDFYDSDKINAIFHSLDKVKYAYVDFELCLEQCHQVMTDELGGVEKDSPLYWEYVKDLLALITCQH